MNDERLQILKMLEAGAIDAQEAATLLAALKESAASAEVEPEVEVLPPIPGPAERRESRWARFWIYPLLVGGGVLLLGGLIISLVYATGAARGWLVCGWVPLFLGLMVVILALWSRRAAWLHVRISEGGKRKMAISFPLPLTLAAWGVRIAQPFVPKLRETSVDELILALRDSASHGQPVFIDVEDEEAGELVEVYLG
jgi:hypothetical protein